MKDTIEPSINTTLINIDHELTNNSNYKDPTVFDIDADLRQELLYEREQFKPLATNVLQFLGLGVRQHALIIGPRGSGKTAIVKYILKETKKMGKFDFQYIYINCRELDNTYKIMKAIVAEKKKIPKDEMLFAFTDQINKSPAKVFLILDEVDLIRDDDLLYNITRKEELNKVSMILITKTPKFYDDLSGDVKSSLKKDVFYFDTYDFYHIKEILTRRAELGFKSYDENILYYIAASNVEHAQSDVRVGIKVLEHIFKNPDYPRATLKEDKNTVPTKIIKQIDELMEQEYMKMKEGVIRNLGETKLTILYFALKHLQSNKAYVDFCKHSYTTLSKSNFLKHVEELAYMDLFFIQRARRGRSTILQFVFNLGEQNERLVSELAKGKELVSD